MSRDASNPIWCQAMLLQQIMHHDCFAQPCAAVLKSGPWEGLKNRGGGKYKVTGVIQDLLKVKVLLLFLPKSAIAPPAPSPDSPEATDRASFSQLS